MAEERRKYTATEVAKTPYDRGVAEWDSRLGGARQQAHHWRLAALVALSLNFVLGAGLIYQSSKAQVVPYVVEVSREEGSVRLVGTPLEQGYKPQEATQKYFLGEWVRDVRSLPADAVVLRQQMERAYGRVEGAAAQQLQLHAEHARVLERLGKEMVQVELTSLTALSEESYQVEWVEKTYSAKGQLLENATWTATLTISHRRPEEATSLKLNPLGLYIKYFSWARKIEAP